jgi:hypothetical protein
MADCKPTERRELIQFRQLIKEAVTRSVEGGAK